MYFWDVQLAISREEEIPIPFSFFLLLLLLRIVALGQIGGACRAAAIKYSLPCLRKREIYLQRAVPLDTTGSVPL